MMYFYQLLFVLYYVSSCTGASGTIAFPCKTPNQENAFCVSLFDCPVLMTSLGSLEPIATDFVKKSMCIDHCSARDFMVCCGKTGNYSENILQAISLITKITTVASTTSESVTTKPSSSSVGTDNKQAFREAQKKLLPSRTFCGFQHTDDRFYEEEVTALDEFPWLVHILFTELIYDSEYGDRCNGVLINSRYVLTDAYCGAEAVIVKLGQYNTTSNVSCTSDPELVECTDTIIIKIAEKARSGKQENGPYDLALLRLAEPVTYTDFIRPICLPVDGSVRPANQNSLIFSGWGANGPGGIIKKRLNYTIAKDEVCYKAEHGLEGNVKFANVTLLCVFPEKSNTGVACNGEHGGPYMYSYRHQWFAEGIIVQAFVFDGTNYETGFHVCSSKDPVSGIKITPTMMDWILNNIRA